MQLLIGQLIQTQRFCGTSQKQVALKLLENLRRGETLEITIYREVDFLMMLENATSKTQDALKSIGMGNFSYAAILDGACGNVPKKKFEQIRKDNIEMLDKLLDYVTKYKGLSPRTKGEKQNDVAEWKSTNLFANRA